MLRTSQDPVYKKIWTDTKWLKRSEVSESILGVYNGKNILIEWKHGLDMRLAKFSTSSGDPLIQISNTPYMGFVVWLNGMYIKCLKESSCIQKIYQKNSKAYFFTGIYHLP